MVVLMTGARLMVEGLKLFQFGGEADAKYQATETRTLIGHDWLRGLRRDDGSICTPRPLSKAGLSA